MMMMAMIMTPPALSACWAFNPLLLKAQIAHQYADRYYFMKLNINHNALYRSISLFLILLVLHMGIVTAQAQNKPEESPESENGDTPIRFELDEIVVTASATEEPLKTVPRNITVVTREDIEQAPSKNIVDLLSRESGINLRSLFGSDKQAVIDIRGMGATAASNVIVMVDGVRMNSSDLSGVDFSTIPLEMIERIEIVRGAGSVIYGSGSTGGVINIVTRKGAPHTETRLYAAYGSYDTHDVRAGVSGSVQDLGFFLNAGYYDTAGYRDNSDLMKQDVAGVFDYYLTDHITLNLSGAYHEDEYGLPGSVGKQDIDSRDDRTQTDYPEDKGETTDKRVAGGFDIETDQWGSLKLVRGYRWRDNDYIVGYSPLLSRTDQEDEIEEFSKSLTLIYDKGYSLFDRGHTFQLGMDHFFTDYIREEAPGGPRQNSQMSSLGLFTNNRWSLSEGLKFQWGYRLNQSEGKIRTDQLVSSGQEQRWVNGDVDSLDWQNTAYDAGLSYRFSRDMTVYVSYATHFRVPNVDELAESEEGLKPQEGSQVEAGGRFQIRDRLETAVTLFNMIIEDEIYYSEINRNYDQNTIRNGIETDIKWYPHPALFIWGNYSYTEATFEGTDATVPLVANHKGSLGLEWEAIHGLKLSATGSYVGSRYDGNDVDNDRYEQLDAYHVWDTKATYARKGFTFFAGVNNLLDALYETSSFSERYYPMPGRHIYAGAEMRF
jgi:iron complex outermembrane recepter protein